jgi:PhnB protein
MASVLNPYLSFSNNARQAMEFYKSVFGGELNVSNFGEGGMPHDPSEASKVMHAQLRSSAGFVLMGSDTPASMGAPRGNGQISLSGNDEKELTAYWNKLSEGGQVMMPLAMAPWGDSFGMLTDKFGVPWMVNISPKG